MSVVNIKQQDSNSSYPVPINDDTTLNQVIAKVAEKEGVKP